MWIALCSPQTRRDAALALIVALGRAIAENNGHGDIVDFLRDLIFG